MHTNQNKKTIYALLPLMVEANKIEIVREGAVPPLLLLSHSVDLKVQRNAAGALLNLTHIGMWPRPLS